MKRNISRLAVAAAAIAAIYAQTGPASAAGSANAATSTPTSASAVTIAGDAHGMKLQNQHTNSDGTVTSTWKNSAGQGFTYAGPGGAQVTISLSATTVAGKAAHRMDISAAPPAHAPGTGKAAAAAYAAAGRSVLKDALNSGADPARAKAKFGPGTKYTTPNATGNPNILNSWCVNEITGSGLVGQYLHANACVTEYLMQSSPEYISDDMEGLAWSDAASITYTGFAIYSDYRSGTVVPPWVPNGSQGTDCSNVTASASWGPFSFSSTSSICGGSYSTMLAHNTFGLHWSGNTYGEIGLEPIDVVSIPNGDDYTVLNARIWWP